MKNEEKVILIPDFMQNAATEVITMTQEEYNEDRKFVAQASYIQGYDACIADHIPHVLILFFCIILLVAGLWYVNHNYVIEITRIPAQVSECI